jgi:hypothetical protein
MKNALLFVVLVVVVVMVLFLLIQIDHRVLLNLEE